MTVQRIGLVVARVCFEPGVNVRNRKTKQKTYAARSSTRRAFVKKTSGSELFSSSSNAAVRLQMKFVCLTMQCLNSQGRKCVQQNVLIPYVTILSLQLRPLLHHHRGVTCDKSGPIARFEEISGFVARSVESERARCLYSGK